MGKRDGDFSFRSLGDSTEHSDLQAHANSIEVLQSFLERIVRGSMMTQPKSQSHRLATRTIHHPVAELPSQPLATPIYQSSTFRVEDAATVAGYAHEVCPQAFYTRWGNPTVEVWEKVVADLEGGEKGLAFASGMAAVSSTLLALLSPGDRVLSGASLYSATMKTLAEVLPRQGITTEFIDPTDTGAFAERMDPAVRMIYAETPANPSMQMADLAALGELARRNDIPLVVDNTFATPWNQRPLELGAAVVLYSATKYLSGHSDVVAGCTVSDAATAERIWKQRTLLGGCLDPFAAWLLLRGMKTFAVRMDRHNANAAVVAEALEKHPRVERVIYPGLESHPQHELAKRQMSGYGGMVGCVVGGGRAAGIRFVESTEVALLAVSLGGTETLLEHPASMSHAMLSDSQWERAGIPPGLVRVSVGLEDVRDLVDDLTSALDRLD